MLPTIELYGFVFYIRSFIDGFLFEGALHAIAKACSGILSQSQALVH